MAITKQDIKFLEKIDRLEPKAKCIRANIAAMIVKDGKVLVSHCNDWHEEYNCKKIGCIRDIKEVPSGSMREICNGMCAEQWCIVLAAKKGIKVQGATMYCTKYPCRVCESMIAESGIKRVVYQEGYRDVMPHFDIMKDKKLTIEQGPNTNYKNAKIPDSLSI